VIAPEGDAMNVLVIDIGGSHVKIACSGVAESRRFDSSPKLTPQQLVDEARVITADWDYQAVSIGIPAIVGPGGTLQEPGNLGDGWIGFEFERAFQHPTRVINDAAMQALGAYDGGRMLFLGFGTGLGSTLIADRIVVPLELGAIHDVNDPEHQALGIRLGKQGLERIGSRAWCEIALATICMFKSAFSADYVVIGGGHAQLIEPLPADVRCGGNDDAFTGGFRLWEQASEPHQIPPASVFRVVR
jgi:polyphosphate glucokinase